MFSPVLEWRVFIFSLGVGILYYACEDVLPRERGVLCINCLLCPVDLFDFVKEKRVYIHVFDKVRYCYHHVPLSLSLSLSLSLPLSLSYSLLRGDIYFDRPLHVFLKINCIRSLSQHV